MSKKEKRNLSLSLSLSPNKTADKTKTQKKIQHKQRKREIKDEEESTGEHKNGGLREVELVDQQVLHALGIINTTLQLMP